MADPLNDTLRAIPDDEWHALGISRPSNHLPSKRTVREIVRTLITPHLRPLIEAQVAQACGLKYLVKRDPEGRFRRIGPEGVDGEGVIEVWEKDPSTPAFTDLLNRAIDKPKEQEQEIILHNSEALLARLDSWKVANRQAALEAAKAAALEAPRNDEDSGEG